MNNKYTLFGFLVFLLLLITYVVDITTGYTVTGAIDTELVGIEDTSVTSVFSMGSTFINILAFKIEGFPDILNLLIFYPITAIVLFMGIDIFKDLIPFT